MAHFRSIPGFSPRPGFCRKGGRAWFQKHNLSWSDFVANGIEADDLLETGDAFAVAIVEHARKEAADYGQQ